MNRQAAISGVGQTSVGSLPDTGCMLLHAQAAKLALADAELARDEIDGVLCGYSLTEPHLMLCSYFCEYFGIRPLFAAAIQVGGATACSMVAHAAALVRAGSCRHVLCVTGDARRTGMSRDAAVSALSDIGHPQFERPYGLTIPAAYALIARRYMHENGTTEAQLAAIAVLHRKNAGRHPDSHMTAPLSLADAMNARTIASPLRLFDCCLISDGGAAVIVSEAAAARDCPRRPIHIAGIGQGFTHQHVIAAPSLTDFACKQSAQRAFAEAELGPADVDVAEIYDSFTITLVVELESMGFFARGEAGAAAAAGELDLNGRLPCNTHGGLLSHGHSGAAGGMFHIVEAVRQLRHSAIGRQVPEAEVAFVHGDGGILSAHCSLVLRRP